MPGEVQDINLDAGLEDEQDGQGLADDFDYEWLRQQLAAGAVLTDTDGMHLNDDEDGEGLEEEWQDPSNGTLTELHNACEASVAKLEEVAALISQLTCDINMPGPDGDTALHLASLYGHADIVRLLLANGGDPDVVNESDCSTPLHDAAAGGYDPILLMLLAKAHADILNATDEDGDTPLHNAARGGHKSTVELLLSRGADPRTLNLEGNTPAGEAEHQVVMQLLTLAQQEAETSAAAARHGSTLTTPQTAGHEAAAAEGVAAAVETAVFFTQ
ncbi:MAG: hypothetical protein WDW36_000474 [Sanguina aurantia]